MKDKEKYFNIIEKDVVKNIYLEALEDGTSYFDKFMHIATNLSDLDARSNFLKRCVMASDADTLAYCILANKIVRFNDKLYNVVDNEISEELDEKLALDIIRILMSHKYVSYASKIMTSTLYYKVLYLKDLKFLDDNLIQDYLFGNKDLPPYFINQFNDLKDKKDKEYIIGELIHLYGMIFDEVPKYYCSCIKDNELVLEYPSDVTKRDKKVVFKFIDLSKLDYKSKNFDKLKRIEKGIKDSVREIINHE